MGDETENYLDFFVNSLGDFSDEDLELITDLNFEFLDDKEKDVSPTALSFQHNNINEDGEINTIKNTNPSIISPTIQSQILNPSHECLVLKEKSTNFIDNHVLKQKIDASTKRLKFLSRWTELSRRQVMLIEKKISPCYTKFYPSISKLDEDYSDNDDKIHKTLFPINSIKNDDKNTKFQSSTGYFENTRRVVDAAKRILTGHANSINALMNNHKPAIVNTFNANNASSIYKLRFSMNRTQISRRMFTDAIQKEKIRRNEVQKQEKFKMNMFNLDQSMSNKVNEIVTRKRKSFTCLDMVRDRPRLTVHMNSSHSANSA